MSEDTMLDDSSEVVESVDSTPAIESNEPETTQDIISKEFDKLEEKAPKEKAPEGGSTKDGDRLFGLLLACSSDCTAEDIA